MSAVAIIPAKGNSKRIPRKNIKLFHGKPIIAYSIEAAQKSGLFDAVWVSTEDEKTGEIAQLYGAQWYPRTLELAEIGAPDCGTQEVTRDALVWLRDKCGITYNHACCIYPTAPMLNAATLINLKVMLTSSGRPYGYTTYKWYDAGQCYFGHSDAFIERVPLSHWNTAHFDVGPESYCDINTPEDWARAEKMYPIWKEKYGTV